MPDVTAYTAEEMREEARTYRHDNDDGSACFFDPDLAEWRLAQIDPLSLGVFDGIEEAQQWLDSEIAMHEADGVPQDHWVTFLHEGIDEPVVVGEADGQRRLWDGYHRTAIAMMRQEPLLALVGRLTTMTSSIG